MAQIADSLLLPFADACGLLNLPRKTNGCNRITVPFMAPLAAGAGQQLLPLLCLRNDLPFRCCGHGAATGERDVQWLPAVGLEAEKSMFIFLLAGNNSSK